MMNSSWQLVCSSGVANVYVSVGKSKFDRNLKRSSSHLRVSTRNSNKDKVKANMQRYFVCKRVIVSLHNPLGLYETS